MTTLPHTMKFVKLPPSQRKCRTGFRLSQLWPDTMILSPQLPLLLLWFFFFLESKNIYSITDIVNVKLKIYTNIRSWQTMLKLTFYFFFKPHTRILHTCTQMNILKQEIWQLPENGLWLISPSFSIKLLSAFETPDQLSITLHKFQHWHKMRPGQTKNPIRLSGGHTSFYT